MTRDIVERLRSVAHTYDEHGVHSEIELEAANEIEKLRKERRAMQQALLAIKAHTQDAHPMSYMDQLCRIARTALGEKE
jgi:hypothetical protein